MEKKHVPDKCEGHLFHFPAFFPNRSQIRSSSHRHGIRKEMYLSHVDALSTGWYAWSFFLRRVIAESLVNALESCLGVLIQALVSNAYLGSVISMPLGWLPRGGGGSFPLDMVVRDNFLHSLRKNG